jgi:hypothetical protein
MFTVTFHKYFFICTSVLKSVTFTHAFHWRHCKTVLVDDLWVSISESVQYVNNVRPIICVIFFPPQFCSKHFSLQWIFGNLCEVWDKQTKTGLPSNALGSDFRLQQTSEKILLNWIELLNTKFSGCYMLIDNPTNMAQTGKFLYE